jgi:tetratricopeptide (TPR) repeat protein
VANDLRQACLLPGADLRAWQLRALVCLKVNDRDGQRQAVAGMLERFGTTDDPQQANGVAWTWALIPAAAEGDADKALKLARKAVAAERNSAHLNTLGAVAYRAGRPEEAIQHLQEAVKLHGQGGTPWDWLLLAMACHRAKRTDEARTWLAKAATWIDKAKAPAGPGAGQPEPLGLDQRLELELLRREAEAVLAGREPKPKEGG